MKRKPETAIAIPFKTTTNHAHRKPLKKPVDTEHLLWRHVRAPFRAVACDAHDWEQYDCDRAGCKRCGIGHRCEGNLVDSNCPVMTNDDESICCMITGFCIPTVRYSKDEYIECGESTAEPSGAPRTPARKDFSELQDEISAIVEWFMSGEASTQCRSDEIDRSTGKLATTLVKLLKQHKIDHPREMPNMVTALGQALHSVRPRQCAESTPELRSACSRKIARCLHDLGLAHTTNRRTGLVVGALYLMKSGLTTTGTQYLPRMPGLAHCLPHETTIEKGLGLSLKMICSSENELKRTLREKEHLL